MDTLVNKIIKLSQEQPDKTAVAFKKEKLTYKQLFDKVLGIAYVLKKKEFNPAIGYAFLLFQDLKWSQFIWLYNFVVR